MDKQRLLEIIQEKVTLRKELKAARDLIEDITCGECHRNWRHCECLHPPYLKSERDDDEDAPIIVIYIGE